MEFAPYPCSPLGQPKTAAAVGRGGRGRDGASRGGDGASEPWRRREDCYLIEELLPVAGELGALVQAPLQL